MWAALLLVVTCFKGCSSLSIRFSRPLPRQSVAMVSAPVMSTPAITRPTIPKTTTTTTPQTNSPTKVESNYSVMLFNDPV